MEPGFQMSFAAVAGLIAVWEYWRDRQALSLVEPDLVPGFAAIRFLWRALVGVALTTLVAGLATGPFAAYHFERVATYSLLGNLLAAPLISLIIMPFGLLALVVMPLGLEALPLHIMARGIDALLAIAAWVASLPGAEVKAPPISPISLLLIVAGMVWLCLWRLRWRLLGVPAIALGLVSIPLLVDRADILVAPEGAAVAVRDAVGTLRVSGARTGSYVVEQFFDKEDAPPADAATLRDGIRCDALACILGASGGMEVSHVLDPAAFVEDCARADVIVSALDAPDDCRARLVIDATQLSRFGAHAIWIDSSGGFRVTTARSRTPRPWEAR
jgi:competence protein ComEC